MKARMGRIAAILVLVASVALSFAFSVSADDSSDVAPAPTGMLCGIIGGGGSGGG